MEMEIVALRQCADVKIHLWAKYDTKIVNSAVELQTDVRKKDGIN